MLAAKQRTRVETGSNSPSESAGGGAGGRPAAIDVGGGGGGRGGGGGGGAVSIGGGFKIPADPEDGDDDGGTRFRDLVWIPDEEKAGRTQEENYSYV